MAASKEVDRSLRHADAPAGECQSCGFADRLCVCASLPVVTVPFRFIVIRHSTEIWRTSNTGRFVPSVVAGSLLIDHGRREAPVDIAPLTAPDTDYFVLYPDPAAAVLEPSIANLARTGRRRLALVVLDGTWSKARRMISRLQILRGFQKVRLEQSPQPRFVLRAPPAPDHYFTLEAVARATAALGYELEAEQIQAASRLVVLLALRLRGRPHGYLPEVRAK